MEEKGGVLKAPLAAIGVMGRNRVSSIVIFILLVALATISLGLWESPIKIRGANLPAPPAAESFVRGQANFDAQLIWDALSQDFVETLELQGQDVDSIQARLNELKDTGVRYTEASYVAGYRGLGGEAYYFYVFSRKNPQGAEELESVPYLLVVNQAGKIERIE